MKRTLNTAFPRRAGFALITALLLLVGLMLLGISGMSTSIFDEKLAGNFAHRNAVYQIAEAALRAGEEEALSLINNETAFASGASSHLVKIKPGAAAASFWNPKSNSDKFDWNGAKTVAVGPGRSSQSAAYVIEEIDDRQRVGETSYFQYLRVTARGLDNVSGAAVVLQSIVRRATSGPPG
jgi:type IV pilus assembly protein PilX